MKDNHDGVHNDWSQFHYGSIKTLLKNPNEFIKKELSQFHYGSIKTDSKLSRHKNTLKRSLNSTMVRLKLSQS